MNPNSNTVTRRHDLDALRAVAMLLGIVLHALMSFVPGLWPIQDVVRDPHVGTLVMLVHGFRMPLFFVVSGFFTALTWKQRGLKTLVQQRLRRIGIPLLLALFTIVPLYRGALQRLTTKAPPQAARITDPVIEAIRRADIGALEHLLQEGKNPNQKDPEFAMPALCWAALRGDEAIVECLLDHGADIRAATGDGSSAIQSAAFVGKDKVVALLLKRGAPAGTRNKSGYTAQDSTYAPPELTASLLGVLRLPSPAADELVAGQKRCRTLLASSILDPLSGAESLRLGYRALLRLPGFSLPIFEHLWFLWFLCWLLPIFAWWTTFSAKLSLAPLWFLPLALIPQLGMDSTGFFGPDTATGLIPPPHLLAYYGVFFFFGVASFLADSRDEKLSRFWWALLPLALGVVFPLGQLVAERSRPLSDLAQVSYAWLMILGSMGLARQVANKSNRIMAYLAKSSYWLYLSHLPVVILLQAALHDLLWPLPLKVLVIVVGTVAPLLLLYALVARFPRRSFGDRL